MGIIVPIEFVRGDSFPIAIEAVDANGNAYTPGEGDTLTMTVRKNSHKGSIAFIKKTGDGDVVSVDGGWQIMVKPDDTSGLDYISYVYDIKAVLNDGYVQTLIKHSPLTLLKAVTYVDPVAL